MTALDRAVARLGVQMGSTSWGSTAWVCSGCGSHSYENTGHDSSLTWEENEARTENPPDPFPHGQGCLYLEAQKELTQLRAQAKIIALT